MKLLKATINPLTVSLTAALMLACVCLATRAHDGGAGGEKHDLAKASQNPISSLISVPFENNSNFNVGPNDSYQNVLNIKPVIPMKLNDDWNWVNRAILPIIYDEDRPPTAGSGYKFGGGDLLYQGFLTPAKAGKWIWGIGPSILLPTGAQELSQNQWAAGPNAVVLTMPGHWVIGALVSNVWGFGHDSDNQDTNLFTAQYFINYNLSKGWYVKTTPVITANWEADSSNTWTVPIGGGVGRIFHVGKQPINAAVQAFYNVEKPDSAGDWTLQATWTFLFPEKK